VNLTNAIRLVAAIAISVILCSRLHGTSTADRNAAMARLSGDSFATRLAKAALERTAHTVRYDPAYVQLAYPGGDVPADTGVCTDEVIRSYRSLGLDLQKLVHQDMCRTCSASSRGKALR
jgi:uncharacterized protein